jgi:pimeloyl-ACP methyl ester carboxylesterase/DNA-binding CsgD family transcriptional regulator
MDRPPWAALGVRTMFGSQIVRYGLAADGLRIAWATSGQGSPAVVMVAGWLSHLSLDSQREIGEFHRALALHHRVVRYDRPGVGLSDRRCTDFTLDYQVDCLGRVVDASGEERVALFARGFGGPVAMAYSARYPERVSQLILFSCTARMLADPDHPEGIVPNLADGMEQLVRADWGVARKAIAEVMLPEASPDLTQWFADYLACAADAETVASLIHAQVRLNVEDLLSKIEAPVLIMHNRDDRALTVMASRLLASQLPSARLLIFEGTSNEPFYGDRASILGAVEGFLGADARLRVMNGRDHQLAAGHLTPRETEISRLLVRGLRNREIAEQLCLSERTVETHVANLLGKLGLNSRSQLAAMDREALQKEASRTG